MVRGRRWRTDGERRNVVGGRKVFEYGRSELLKYGQRKALAYGRRKAMAYGLRKALAYRWTKEGDCVQMEESLTVWTVKDGVWSEGGRRDHLDKTRV